MEHSVRKFNHFIHSVLSLAELTHWIPSRESINESKQWVYPLGACHGSNQRSQTIYSNSIKRFTQWIHAWAQTYESLTCFSQCIPLTDSINGFSHRLQCIDSISGVNQENQPIDSFSGLNRWNQSTNAIIEFIGWLFYGPIRWRHRGTWHNGFSQGLGVFCRCIGCYLAL